MDVFDQAAIDEKMRDLDGTTDMSKLGGNAIGSVSNAVFLAAAACRGVPLYEHVAKGPIETVQLPIFNIINGDRSGDRQDTCYEYMIVPYGAKDIYEAVQMGVEVSGALPEAWKEHLGQSPAAGAAYGFKAHSADPAEVLALMQRAIDNCGYTGKIGFAMDCAAVDVYDAATNTYPWMGKRVTAHVLIDHFKRLTEKFPIVFIEESVRRERLR